MDANNPQETPAEPAESVGAADPVSAAGSASAADPVSAAGSASSVSVDDPATRRRLGGEVLILLGLSLGQSGVYAAISLAAKLTAGRPLAQQTATLNASQSSRPYLDLTYQLVGIGFTLVPVALALWLLSANTPNVIRLLGLNRDRPHRDLAFGLGLAALIGLPGLALYFIGHALGITANIVPAALNPAWWTVPVLILQAVKNAVLEEVIVVGYLLTRLKRLGWSAPAIVGASAVLRGSYHLYQGFGPFIGNAIMGVIFAEWFRRGGRIWPLIVAHSVLDIVSFVGYDLFGGVLGLK
jgi:membrane protease YdiL (CAAX protease family)